MNKSRASQPIIRVESITSSTSSIHVTDDAFRRRIQFVMVFFSIQTSLFLAAMENTVIATSIPTIATEFQAMSIASWAINSYALTFNAFQPLFSKFSDIFGRKVIIICGLGVFMLGSLLCGLAKTIVMLIVCRGIQGIGAASIFSMVFIIISDIVPLEKRGSYQGFITAVFAVASVVGPLMGGAFTDHISWRWIFYINLPIGGVAIVLLFFFLHLPMEKQNFKERLMRIDYMGNFLVLASAVLFLLAMNFGGQTFPWESAAVIVPFVLAGVLVITLVIVEIKFAKEPLMPPRLFKKQSVVAILLLNLFFGIGFYAVIFFLPLYFQAVRGDSAMWSGIRLIPMQMGISSSALISGLFISKFVTYRFLNTIGMSVCTLAIGLFILFSVNTSWSMIYGITVVGGLGMGLIFTASVIALQSAVEGRDIAVALGLQNFVRTLGGALGVAIASTLLNSSLKADLPNVIPMKYAEQVLDSPGYIRNGLPSEYVDAAISTYANSMRSVWIIIVIITGIGVLCSLFIKNYPLRRPGPGANKANQTDQQQISEEVYQGEASCGSSSSKPGGIKVVIVVEDAHVGPSKQP
ncbi:major facilitator superfamily domain-containing protein [Fennellomyces sp. T-0311]|nr:major facilitator superfamily domain-containing protein [Fennellomyces sp. T-0311]